MQFRAILLDSLRESLDRKVFWALLLISAIVAAAMASIGFAPDHISIFGKLQTMTTEFNPQTVEGRGNILDIVIRLVTDVVLNWIGMLLILVATAGFLPTMLERGAIDVVLAKPIGRTRLFLYKYAAAMVFVLLQASIFAALVFLVMGLRWGVWAPRFLIVVPLAVLLFSYLYCVSALVAVTTRSTLAAILITIAAWFVFTVPQTVKQTMDGFGVDRANTWYRLADAARWIPPKTADIAYLAARSAGTSRGLNRIFGDVPADASPTERAQWDAAQRADDEMFRASPLVSIGSSLAFEFVLVAIAAWRFNRRDF